MSIVTMFIELIAMPDQLAAMALAVAAEKHTMKQKKPFQITLTQQTKDNLKALAKQNGCHYGIMFDTSGKAHTERINPNAQYNYVYRTDEN